MPRSGHAVGVGRLRQQPPQSPSKPLSRGPRLHVSACGSCHRGQVRALRASSQFASRAPASRAARPNEVRRSAPSATCCRLFRSSRKFKAAAASPQVWPSSVRGPNQSQHAPARRGLTPPSSRAPTASHRGRATVQFIICSAAPASRRWCRLMSNVRQHTSTVPCLRATLPSPCAS